MTATRPAVAGSFFPIPVAARIETFKERSILLKFKEGENFNHRNTLKYFEDSALLHFVPKFEPDAEIGQKEALCKGLE